MLKTKRDINQQDLKVFKLHLSNLKRVSETQLK